MIRIKNILKISIPLFIIHAVEEYMYGMVQMDPFFQKVSDFTQVPLNIVYFVEQLLLVLVLLWAVYQPRRWLHILIGAIFVFEITHVTRAISIMSYYPGLITGVLLLVLGGIYWKQLFKGYSRNNHVTL